MKRFFLLLALPLIFAACEPDPVVPDEPNDPGNTETPVDPEDPEDPEGPEDPENPGGPEEPETPVYDFEYEMAASMRLPSAEYELPEHYFALAFVDDAENVEFGLVLVGNEGDTVLQAGEYTSEAGNCLAEVCELCVYDVDQYTEFKAGVATVTLDGENYGFDVVLTSTDDKVYHITYEGVVLDMEQEPVSPSQPEVFSPVKVVADYWSSGNFCLQLYVDNSYYHELDMYDFASPNDNYLTAGTYVFDSDDAGDLVIGGWSIFGLPNDQSTYIIDAEMTVVYNDAGETTLVGYIKSDMGHHLNINWTGVVEGFNLGNSGGGEVPEGDIVLEATHLVGEYYEPNPSWGVYTHNYYILLANVETDGDSLEPNSICCYLDLYSDEVNETLTIPNGVYEFDPYDTYETGTAGAYYTTFYVTDADKNLTWLYPVSGEIVVSDGKIEAEFLLEDGRNAYVTYEGNLSLQQHVADEEYYYTTLTGDYEVNITGASIYVEYYGDYYGVGSDLYYVQIFENSTTKSGGYLCLELLTDYYADNWYSVDYEALTSFSSDYNNKFVAGSLSGSSLSGTWYAELDGGYVGDVRAPFIEGTIDVEDNGGGVRTLTLNCYDDAGNNITGTVVGSYATSSSALAKSGAKKSMQIPTMKSFVFRK